ncbi:MAG: iron-sulfur cluster binding protein [Candidatus Magnetoglobus multicellularis str. Araruama]|uniref:Iron-sulfur cluster binding protein n=1 Tax=Candidatus Magnetoglobus multicellularis str. Araruama TaxID=890399 RepID=A0A1V1PA69_9BACT|nr:MAG: iron-sulfur cluster binding protein [Candidatus Magnetoglobus multicellularis str. Araruama]
MKISNNIKSWIQYVQMSPPCLGNNMADVDRLMSQLQKQLETRSIEINLSIMAALPEIIRKSSFHVRCMLLGYDNHYQLIDVQPADTDCPIYGIAIDLGTTRVVLRLLDILNQQTVDEITMDNPQSFIAPDVLARIHYTDQPGGLKHLQQLIIDAINEKILHLSRNHAISPKDILCMSVAGNTAMTHLFLGFPPHAIIREPYIPVVNKQLLVPAAQLGIKINTNAQLFVFPNIGSYFGGDLIAGILSLNMHQQTDIAIMVDVGTNAEVVLGNKDWMLACAGAAGPALESGVSKIGMTAGSGAIERITMERDSFVWQTIDNQKPIGICGSGIIDLASALFQSGMLDIRGKLMPDRCKGRLQWKNDIMHFMVVPKSDSGTGEDLTISQVDIDSLVRSKAAMYTILTTITGAVGMALTDIAVFYVAGTFGAYIDPKSAINIGMIPDLPMDRYQSVGNTSLEGATRVLLSRADAESVSDIYQKITYMELNVNQEFMNRFSAAKFLPHTDMSLFPSVEQPS